MSKYKYRYNHFRNERTKEHIAVWEEYYGIRLPQGCVIHHINQKKDDNRIENLTCMTLSAHMKLHTTGENHPFFGKHHTEESKRKISESKKGKYLGENNPNYGRHHTDETKEKLRLANSGENSGKWKDYARLLGAYKRNDGNPYYIIKKEGRIIKQSVNLENLKRWFRKTYPTEYLAIELKKEEDLIVK